MSKKVGHQIVYVVMKEVKINSIDIVIISSYGKNIECEAYLLCIINKKPLR